MENDPENEFYDYNIEDFGLYAESIFKRFTGKNMGRYV